MNIQALPPVGLKALKPAASAKAAQTVSTPRFGAKKKDGIIKRGVQVYNWQSPGTKKKLWATAAVATTAAIVFTPLSLFGLGGLLLAGEGVMYGVSHLSDDEKKK